MPGLLFNRVFTQPFDCFNETAAQIRVGCLFQVPLQRSYQFVDTHWCSLSSGLLRQRTSDRDVRKATAARSASGGASLQAHQKQR
jgi:hypothetical protein